jgi:hypothetical protein
LQALHFGGLVARSLDVRAVNASSGAAALLHSHLRDRDGSTDFAGRERLTSFLVAGVLLAFQKK